MILEIGITAVFLIFGHFIYELLKRKWLQYPPGPVGLPLVGNLLQFGTQPHLTFRQWAKLYKSDTISCSVGSRNMVILHDWDTIKKTLSNEASTGRECLTFGTKDLQRKDGIHYGLMLSEGDLWKEQRQFTITTLKAFGMGKTWFEGAVIAEAEDLCRVFDNYQGQPVNPAKEIYPCVSNVICAMVLGKRFDHSDDQFCNLSRTISDQVVQSKDDFLFIMCPYLKYIPGRFRNRCTKAEQNYKAIVAFTQDIAQEHTRVISAASADHTARDYIDAYISKESSSERADKNTCKDKQLEVALYDIFAAGTETTSTTNVWCLLFMLEYPEIMKKVQVEIDCSIEHGRSIRYSDKALLPFTEATIFEVQRMASIGALSIPHRATTDMVVDGYFVPKDSLILPNLYSVDHDPRYWKDPERFDPTRFLNNAGIVERPDVFASFGAGKRSCIGEPLAKMELFIIFANLMQRFDIKLAPGCAVSHTDYDQSIVLTPKPFEVVFSRRTHFSNKIEN